MPKFCFSAKPLVFSFLLPIFIAIFLTACGGKTAYIDRGYAPVANAGEDQNIIAGATVMLDGSKSTDDDGDALSYSWILLEKPQGSASTLNNYDNVEVSFTPDTEGEYIFQLIVNDGTIDSPLDIVKIIVTSIPSSQICTPNTTESRDCSIDNGSGAQAKSCATDGLSWGDYENCAVSSCNTGYHEEGNSCVVNPPAQICTPNTTESQSCSIDNGSGSQTRSCVADGLSWNDYESCAVTSCNSGYHQEDNACVVDAPTQVCTPNATEARDCAIDNGLGSQTRACAADGLAWGDYENCAVNSCNSGYHKESNSCAVNSPTQVCTPNAIESKDCAIANGAGTQARTCAVDGLVWGDYESCAVTTCDSGYHKQSNSCVIDTLNNTPPTVEAGSDKTIDIGKPASFSAIAKDDGEIKKVEWFNEDNLLIGNELGLVLINLALGEHTLTVKVTDDGGLTATDTVKITITKEDETVLGSLSGKVLDQKGVFIPNAKISLATGQTTVSNGKGYYLIKKLSPIERTTVTGSKNSFLQNSDIVQIESGKETIQNIILSRPKKIQQVDTSKNTTIETDGMTIKLPKDSFIDKKGNKVEGKISLSTSYFPITTEEGVNEFPGDLQAERAGGEKGKLTSFGFIKIDLKDEDGNNIQLKPGGEVELSIPADDSLDKPATIPFWSFDEDKGKWVEEGVATYDPVTNTYKTAVDTVNRTFNLDAFSPDFLGDLEICVEDTHGNKLESNIIIEPINKAWRSTSKTSIDGLLNLKGLIGDNQYSLYSGSLDGRVATYSNNPLFINEGENKLDECIIIDGSNNARSVAVSGTVEDSSGSLLPDLEVILYGNSEGLSFGEPSLVEISKIKTDQNGKYQFDFDKGNVFSQEVALLGKSIAIKAISIEGTKQIDIPLIRDNNIYDNKNIIISANQPPIANAGLDEIIFIGDTVALKASKSYDTDTDDSIKEYEWREANQILSTSEIYSSSSLTLGEHIIVLTVTDQYGLKSSDEVKVSIIDKQTHRLYVDAGFDQSVYAGDILNPSLTNTKTISVGSSISQVQWKEGDNLLSDKSSFQINDLSLGEHTITLQVKNEHGLEDSDEVVITVVEKLHELLVNAGLDKTFTDGEYIVVQPEIISRGSDQTSYQWMEGNNILGTEYSLTDPNLSIGEHILKLTVTYGNGLIVSDEVIITVKESEDNSIFVDIDNDREFYVEKDFDNEGLKGPQDLTAVFKSIDSPLTTYKWFLDNELIYDYAYSQRYDRDVYSDGTYVPSWAWKERDLIVGLHILRLEVTNRAGIVETDEIKIYFREITKHFLVADAGVDKSFYLGDEVLIGNNGRTKSIGSLFTSTVWTEGGKVLYSYTDKDYYSPSLRTTGLVLGAHTITRTVKNAHGLEESDDVVITIVEKPISSGNIFADAGVNKTIYEGDQAFIGYANKSSSINGNLQYKWEQGSNVISTAAYVSYYTPELGIGTHTIKLTVTDDQGEVASDEMLLTIVKKPLLIVSAEAGLDRYYHKGEIIRIRLGEGSLPIYAQERIVTWLKGNTIINKDQYGGISFGGNSSNSALEIGVHTITLKITDLSGQIIDTDEIKITVSEEREAPPININIGSDKSVYLGSKTLLQLAHTGTTSIPNGDRKWIEGDDLVLSTDNYFYYEAKELGQHTIKVIVTDKTTGNIIGTEKVVITVVEPKQKIHADAGLDKTVYLGTYIPMDSSRSYSFGGILNDPVWMEGENILTENFGRYVADTLGKHSIKLTVTDNNGLTDTDEVVFSVIPKPEELYADAGKDRSIYKGETIRLTLNESYSLISSIKSAKWTENDTEIGSFYNFDYKGETVGEHRITLILTDYNGLTATDDIIITVVADGNVDRAKPVITLLGEETITVTQGELFVDPGATAMDDRDGVITSSITTYNNLFTTYTPGTYRVVYFVQDRSGNKADSVTRTIIVEESADIDVDRPVITLIGDNPVSLIQGTEYNDAGITVQDNRDGVIGYSFNSNININIPGTYQVVYTAKDKAGNTSTVTRTVHVIADPNIIIDTTLPVITLKGNQTVSLVEGSVYTDEGATARDDTDGDISASITVDNPVDTSIVKDYTVTYTVKDKAGNEATLIRTVKVTKKPKEPDTLPLMLVKSLEWLETQKQTNGSYANSAKVAMAWQSTAEVLRAYHKVNEVSATGIVPAKAYLNAEDSKKVESLARKIIMGSESGDGVSALVSELVQLQNLDSGFGDQMHYHSRVTDTAFALKALGMAQIADTTIINKGINYLKTQQSTEGGFSHSSKNDDSVYETALVLSALKEFTNTFNLTAMISSSTKYLMDNQAAGGAWDTHWESALALLAIEPTADNKAAYLAAADKLKAAQLSNGSWSNEVYTTALAIRAIYKAENLD